MESRLLRARLRRRTGRRLAAAVFLAVLTGQTAAAAEETAADPAGVPLSHAQLSVLMFVDQGRSYGYQVMMARIQLDTVRADLERDAALLARNEELYGRNAIPLIDLEIARLKDTWNRRQLVVAEKNLAFVSAEYEAMALAARHFGRGDVAAAELYETFRRGWEAGCAKGPDEVEAMQAWVDFAARSLDRARDLQARNVEPYGTVLEREAQLAIARSNYENRRAGLERCRNVLFPSLDDILAIAP
jgi:hypothetical protein